MHRFLFASLAMLAISACQSMDFGMEREQEVALADVPAVVLAAAKEAVPGIEIEAAEIETEKGETVYELEGVRGDREYEIEISPSGEVLEIETDEESGK